MATSKKPAIAVPGKRFPFKKDPPALAKREETQHKDLDHDGERGESPAHKAKVLGGAAGKPAAKKPMLFGGKQATPFGKK
jgi:hypothetical protein